MVLQHNGRRVLGAFPDEGVEARNQRRRSDWSSHLFARQGARDRVTRDPERVEGEFNGLLISQPTANIGYLMKGLTMKRCRIYPSSEVNPEAASLLPCRSIALPKLP